MTEQPIGPRCGNNPNVQLTPGDRQVVADFRAFLDERTALRDRIANRLAAEFTPDGDVTQGMRVPDDDPDLPGSRRVRPTEAADAVLAVLPPPADRAAVLREAAAAIEAAQAREEATAWAQSDEPDPEIEVEGGAVRAMAALLRRLAAEAQQQPATEAEPESCAHCGRTIRRITGTLNAWWVHAPGGQAMCHPWQPASSTRATPKPAAGARQDGAQS
jgi:hypothetical protein